MMEVKDPQSWNWSAIFDAMDRDNDAEVDLCLGNTSIQKYRDENENTLLHIAARCGNTRLLKKYIEYGIDVNSVNCFGETPLMMAAISKSLEAVRLLIKSNATVNHARLDGQTSLHYSIYSKNLSIINLLIDADSSVVNVMDKHGVTALHVAVCHKSYKIIHLLVNRGTDVNLGINGKTPLCLAVRNDNVKIARILLAAGATKVDFVFESGATLLHVAVGMNNIDITRRILDQGVDINASDENGLTAFHHAISVGDYDQVKLLVARGVDLSINFKLQQCSPLHFATFNKTNRSSQKIIKLLLLHHCDVNERNSDGSTPLHMVLKAGTVDDIELLTAFGADVYMQNYFGASVIHYAAMNDDPAICRYLLINYKLNVNERCAHGIAPIHFAAVYGKAEVVRELIARGARVNIKNLDDKSPLHFAVVNKRVETVRVLLEEGAEINMGKQENDMVLMAAIERGSKYSVIDIMMYLVLQEAKGLSINPLNLQIIEKKGLQDLLEVYRVELMVMKNMKVYNHVSYFDILAGSKSVISGYFRNNELVENFKDTECISRFPNYRHMLMCKMDWAVTRDQFERYASRMLFTLLPISHPEHLIIQRMTKFLYETDLPNWQTYDRKGEFPTS